MLHGLSIEFWFWFWVESIKLISDFLLSASFRYKGYRVGILTWEEVEASAQDRQTWRQRVALCIGDAAWIKSSSQAYSLIGVKINDLPSRE